MNGINRLNFELISYRDSMNIEQKASHITKDGFSFLVMGYTGGKAGKFCRLLAPDRFLVPPLYNCMIINTGYGGGSSITHNMTVHGLKYTAYCKLFSF